MSSLSKGHDSASPKNANRTQTMLMSASSSTQQAGGDPHQAPTQHKPTAASHFHHGGYHYNHHQLIATLASSNGSALKKGIAGNPFGTAVKMVGNGKREEAIESGGTIITEDGLSPPVNKEEST